MDENDDTFGDWLEPRLRDFPFGTWLAVAPGNEIVDRDTDGNDLIDRLARVRSDLPLIRIVYAFPEEFI